MPPRTEPDDITFINNANLWPVYPILPLKARHRDSEHESGFILAVPPYLRATVFLRNFLEPELSGQSFSWVIDNVPHKVYESVEKVVEDWMVD